MEDNDSGIEIDSSVELQEETVTEPTVPEKEKVFTSPLSDVKRVDINSLLDDAIYVVPGNAFKRLVFGDKLDIGKINNLSNETIETVRRTIQSPDGVRDTPIHQIDDVDQNPTYGDHDIQLKDRSLKIPTGEISSIEQARIKALSALGLSTRVSVPLYNSGFWITLEAMGDKEFLDLDYKLSEETLQVGRTTNGAIYSNDSIVYDAVFLEFIKDYIIYSSLDVPLNEVTNFIKATDIDIIITMLMHNFFKTGFELRIPCSNVLEVVDGVPKCNAVYDFKVNPKLLIQPIGERLHDKNIRLLANEQPNSVSIADVEEYLINDEIEKYSSVDIKTVNDTVTFRFKSPSIEDKVLTGKEWINTVMMYVNDIIVTDDEKKEASVANNYLVATKLNTYIHFIESISYSDGTIVTWENKEVLMETLSSFSSGSEEILLQLLEALSKYTLATTKYVIGIPTFKCLSCNKDNNSSTDIELTKDIIPIDVMQDFFLLATVKREKMLG